MKKQEKICLVSIDVEPDSGREGFQGVEQLDNILDVLKKEQVSATLFVSGEVLEKHPEKFQELAKPPRPPAAGGQSSAAGEFEIASHSFSHRFWNTLNQEQREQEIDKVLSIHQQVLGRSPLGFRAPSHIMDTDGIKLLTERGFKYDSSILPHYPFFLRYSGFLGRAPKSPYHPDPQNCRRVAQRSDLCKNCRGLTSAVLEIPVAGQMFGIPLVGTWLRKLPFFYFRKLFFFKKPEFITLTLHSWDSLHPKTLRKFKKLLYLLKAKGYRFLNGQQISQRF